MKALDSQFFIANRQRVYEKLNGGVLVVAAYTQMQRGNDAAFQFEQEANFWYITGVEHPDWWMIMDGSRQRSWLVAPEVSDVHALFDGSLSRQDAAEISGIKDVIDHQEGLDLLRQIARKHQLIHTIDMPAHHDHFGFTMNPGSKNIRDQLERMFAKVEDFRPKLAKLRAIKQPDEINAIQSAIDLTNKSFQSIYNSLDSYKFEYQIEAQFSYDFRYAGAAGHAYDPIIASGANACTLHYGKNQDKLRKQTLLLIDVGARVNGYAADITRTYAIGAPTKRQIAVHGKVQSAQQEIIKLLKPGLSVEQYQQKVDEIMKQAVLDLGLMSSPGDEDAYRRYFPHAISHGLGIDVHDALGRPETFQPGMVLTVEPGIYIPEEGVGVRIEDDILITETGHRNMSAKLSTKL